MRKLIVLGTVLALVLALELQAHTPAQWLELPVPVPTFALDGTLDGLASSPGWQRYVLWASNALEQWKADGVSTYSVNFVGQDALVGMLPNEQIEKTEASCGWFSMATRMNRYALWVHSEFHFVDLTRTGCSPCLKNPNEAGCENCLTWPEGIHDAGGGWLASGTLNARLYSIVGGYHIDELENLVVRYRYAMADHARCAEVHSHKPGLGTHIGEEEHGHAGIDGDYSQWYLMSSLRSGTVTPPADPVDPVDPVDPIAPTVDTAAWQARVDSLNALLVGQADQLKILSAENARLAAASAEGETVTIRDTVEVATVDTLLYCPKTNDELSDLFETFTGLADSTDAAGSGKAVSSVQLRSWGAIKALIAVED